MQIIDIRRNSDKNILNESINLDHAESHCLATKELMPIGIPAFSELSPDCPSRAGGKLMPKRTAKWPFIERPLHFDLF